MASRLTVCESESSFFFFKAALCHNYTLVSKASSHKCFLQSPVRPIRLFPVFRWKWRQSNTADGTNADWSKRELVHHRPLGGSTIKAHQTAVGNLSILMSKEVIMSEGGPKQRHAPPPTKSDWKTGSVHMLSGKSPHWLKQQESKLFYGVGSEVHKHISTLFESNIWKSVVVFVLFFSSTMSIFYSQLFSFMRKQELNDKLNDCFQNNTDNTLQKCLKKTINRTYLENKLFFGPIFFTQSKTPLFDLTEKMEKDNDVSQN